MDTLTACLICDGSSDATDDETIEAWQYLIDTGIVWTLQGYYGRQAMQLIENGICTMTKHEEVDLTADGEPE